VLVFCVKFIYQKWNIMSKEYIMFYIEKLKALLTTLLEKIYEGCIKLSKN